MREVVPDVLEGRDGLGAVRSEAPLDAAHLDAVVVRPLADGPDLLRVPAEVPVPQLPERGVVDDVGGPELGGGVLTGTDDEEVELVAMSSPFLLPFYPGLSLC